MGFEWKWCRLAVVTYLGQHMRIRYLGTGFEFGRLPLRIINLGLVTTSRFIYILLELLKHSLVHTGRSFAYLQIPIHALCLFYGLSSS